jgi:hypothetical protein
MRDLVESTGTARRTWLTGLVLAAAMWALPQVAAAQSIAGTVKDTSGSVLPGVTIEASSPVLIEKTRTAVTDGTGQYRLENLAPGVYTVTYTLTGFAVVQRTAVDIQSGVTVTLNTELRVGAVAETITVTGETPVVDIQNSTRVQKVLNDQLISALPATRGYGNLLATVPGIQATGLANTGTAPAMNFFTSRGGRSNEGTIQIDGMNVGSAFNGGGVSSYAYDTSNSAEVQITIAGGLGETDRGGPQFNLVPKTGGNTFNGTYFGSIAGKWSQGTNLDDTLRSYGIADPATLFKSWDTSFAFGGPIMKDKLWFYAVARTLGAYTGIANFYANLNAGDATKWNYVADRGIQERNANSQKVLGSRFTFQATPRNKFSFYYDYQKDCQGGAFTPDSGGCRSRGDDWVAVGAFGSWAPEAAHMWDDREKITQASWSSPVTSRLLLEAGYSQYLSNWGGQTPPGALDKLPFVPVLEQGVVGTGVPVANFIYHGFAGLGNNYQSHNVWRASGTYVTGAHSLKVGYQAAYEVTNLFGNYALHGLQYRFNLGVPNQLTQRITPWQQGNRTRYDGFYAQDQYTVKRLTVQGALRYEHAWSFFPEGQSGLLADSAFGGKAYTLPEAKGVKGYNDIAPRVGMAYDIFGTGKTAIKVNLAKYWQTASNDGQYQTANPAATFVQTTTRGWVDGNKNFTPDCNLNNRAAQDNRASGGDLCGAWDVANFGSISTATVLNPAVLEGWGIRPYDWQFSASVQQQIMPRVSAEIGYSRRWWGNFFFTDNRAVGPQDFDTMTFNAPNNPNLPNAGQPVSYALLKESGFGKLDNYSTFASDYGDVDYHWQGVDLTVDARPRNGLTLQGGFTTGAGYRDYCGVTAKLPELLNVLGTQQQVSSCHIEESWLWNVRGLVTYVFPKVDVQVSGILRSMANTAPTNDPASNGASQAGNYVMTNAQVIAAAGRPLAGNGQVITVNLSKQGDIFPDRLNTVDMRFSKILKFGRTRSNVGIDLYNLFNANTGTVFNQAYGADGSAWLRETAILNARFMRFNATIDF